MKNTLKIALVGMLGLGLVACGSESDDADAGIDAGTTPDAAPATPDTAPATPDTAPATPEYVWLAIQDTEEKACTTNGPGSDIDAVELLDSTGKAVMGVGLTASATYVERPVSGGGPSCEPAAGCNGKQCSHAAPYATVNLVEGPKDAKTYSGATSDTGYFSLNGGTVQIQIGDPTGAGPAKRLKKGDLVRVWEVDHTYYLDASTISGPPETFQVVAQSDDGKQSVTLVPKQLDALNETAIGGNTVTCQPLSTLKGSGCGTTVFEVP